MAQQTSISSLSEAECCVVFECVFDYVSDIRTLISLSLVSKQTRSAVYQSNGLRCVTCLCVVLESHLELNGVIIAGKSQERKLKDGLRWIWTIGKRLKTICLIIHGTPSWCFYDAFVFSLINGLAATEKRRIETFEIRGVPCDWVSDLVLENRNTLRCLRVNLSDQQHVSSLCPSKRRCLYSKLPENQNLWSSVQQCERLESLDIGVTFTDSIPAGLCNILCGTPLKHLSLQGILNNSLRQKLTEVLSCDNLRNNLESLTTDCNSYIFRLLSGRLAGELTGPHLSAGFLNVKRLTFDFVALCGKRKVIDWLAFWAIFPAVIHIKDNYSCRFVVSAIGVARMSQNVINFCKTYLDVSATRSIEVEIPVQELHRNFERTQQLTAAIMTAATLPDDQAWCNSHGVQIETETRDEKAERVTLRKDTCTLVFDLKWTKNE